MTGDPSENASGEARTPLHKNVWIWAFLIGIVLVTLMRPLLRRVPAPPAVLAQLPAFELVDAGGERFGLADLEAGVWVLGFFSARGDAAGCEGLIESMTELGRRYDEAGIDEVLLLGIESGSTVGAAEAAAALRSFGEARGLGPPRWVLAGGASQETRRLAEALLEATGGMRGPAPAGESAAGPCRLFLVDGSGGIRGAYRDDTKGLDEVYHRAQHVAGASGS